MPKVLIKRGTRSQLDAAKNASGLNAGELYLITDEGKLAVGTAANAYVETQTYDTDIPTVPASQAEMEAGTEAALRSMSPLRVKQAIAALGAGGSTYRQYQLFLTSGSFTPPATGKYRVYVCGAGGSGGVAWNSTTYRASGGGAGGMARKDLTLSSSVTYTATVGTGGTAVSRSTSGATAGNAGGNSTFSGSDISTLTGNGGGAGQASISGTASGATGGTASGGDVNWTGGGSGQRTTNNATGGGAINIAGTAYASGDNCNGGAGVGGASTGSNGGGAGGSGDPGPAAVVPLNPDFPALVGGGAAVRNLVNGTGTVAYPAGPGGGGGPLGCTDGGFGGGGGSGGSIPGVGGQGAGGSGAVATFSTVNSGKGGDGFILILW